MGGNTPGGNFPGRSLMGENFPGGNFPRTKLKEVKYFKEIADFRNLYCNIKCFKEKRLKSLHKAERI